MSGQKRRSDRSPVPPTTMAAAEALYAALPVPTLLIGSDCRVRLVNPKALDLIDRPAEEVIGSVCGAALGCAGVHEETMQCGRSPDCAGCVLHRCVADALERGVAATGRHASFPARGGEVVHLMVSTTPVQQDGDALAVLSLLDVSEGVLAMSALKESESRWRALADGSPDHVVLLDEQLRVVYTNRTSPGLAPDDLLGVSILDFLPPDQVERVRLSLMSVLERGCDVRYPTTFDGPDGTIHYESCAGPLLRDGVVVGVALSARDVTLQHRLQEELEERQRRLRSMIDVTDDALHLIDPGGVLVECNEATARAFGGSREDLLGRSIWDRMHPEIAQRRQALVERVVATGQPLRVLDRRDQRQMDALVYPVVDGDGVVERVVVHARDVTEALALQAKLAETERLSSVGLLAAGVAHEVNNPLAYILLNLQELEARLESQEKLDDEVAELLQDATAGLLRVRDIVQDLGTYCTDHPGTSERVDLGRLVDRCLQMARNETRFRAQVITDLRARDIVADQTKLEQLVLNLVVNAAHAIDEGDVEANSIEVATRSEGDDVILTVRDSGSGIAEEHLGRVFQPFFTTKESGKGSGLGLSICKRIVDGMGGDIEVESVLGQGSLFRVRLPRGRPEASLGGQDGPAVSVGREVGARLLVVDDEPHVCRALERILQQAHEVLCCRSGLEALALLEADRDFDAIVCDLMMPEVTGMDLHDWVRRHCPELRSRMLFMTGGVFTARAAAFVEQHDIILLDKPFSARELWAGLARVLNRVAPV